MSNVLCWLLCKFICCKLDLFQDKLWCPLEMKDYIKTHQGHGRIGGHYFHAWCPYVRPKKQKHAATLTLVPENKIRATTDTMCEDNDHLLVVAWWVILNSLDLYFSYSFRCLIACHILLLIHSANPKLRPVGIIVFAHVVRPSPLFKSRKTKQRRTMFAIGVTMGLAEWIIDDTCLCLIYCSISCF